MEYNRIVAVTGMPGLFEVISSKADGAIVKGLEDKATKFVSSRIHNLSHLESIEVYTVKENVVLSDIFIAMKNSNTPLPDAKDNNAVKSYFEKVYPDLDFERVYASDMKKMIKWFEVLEQNKIDYTVKPQQEEEPEEIIQPAKSETKKEEKKEKKAAPVKEAADSKAKPQKKEVEKEEKPAAKKAATKKAAKKEEPSKPAAKKAAKKAAPKKAAKKK
jgi:outer membrane biosynthesis protein TonB